jgi:ketose-bisphosphate aldolase
MRIVPMKALMDAAYRDHYAVPAFNVCNFEMMKGVLTTAEKKRSPVILGIHPVEVAYFGSAAAAVGVAKAAGEGLDIDVAIHLDHGDSEKSVMGAIRGGFSSVMFDGSALPLEKNVAQSRRIVEIAHAVGVTVEGEVGTIGMTDEFGAKLENAHLSDPDSAERLAATGIDCLAVAIGNAHGFYVDTPKLRFDLVEEIVRRVKIPLVLHGGTGIPRDQVQRAISMGVAKMNVGTAIRFAFVSAVKALCDTEPVKDLALMTLGRAGMESLSETAIEYIDICMSGGRLG